MLCCFNTHFSISVRYSCASELIATLPLYTDIRVTPTNAIPSTITRIIQIFRLMIFVNKSLYFNNWPLFFFFFFPPVLCHYIYFTMAPLLLYIQSHPIIQNFTTVINPAADRSCQSGSLTVLPLFQAVHFEAFPASPAVPPDSYPPIPDPSGWSAQDLKQIRRHIQQHLITPTFIVWGFHHGMLANVRKTLYVSKTGQINFI